VATILIVAACALVYELCIGTLSTYLIGDSALQFSLTIGVYLAAMGAGASGRSLVERHSCRCCGSSWAWPCSAGSRPAAACAHVVLLDGYPYAMVAMLSVLGVLIGMELPLLAELLKRAVVPRVLSPVRWPWITSARSSVRWPFRWHCCPRWARSRPRYSQAPSTWPLSALLFPSLPPRSDGAPLGVVAVAAVLVLAACSLGGRQLVREQVLSRRNPARADHTFPAHRGDAVSRRPAPVVGP
jgi:hypothetical protein